MCAINGTHSSKKIEWHKFTHSLRAYNTLTLTLVLAEQEDDIGGSDNSSTVCGTVGKTILWRNDYTNDSITHEIWWINSSPIACNVMPLKNLEKWTFSFTFCWWSSRIWLFRSQTSKFKQRSRWHKEKKGRKRKKIRNENIFKLITWINESKQCEVISNLMNDK